MCIFCKIINNEIPNYTIYENDDVLAFLDIAQVTKGHTLVIPKKHYQNMLDCTSQDLQKVMNVVQMVAKKLQTSLKCDGMNIISNVNEVAGQTVFHFHVHLIPRYSENDACQISFNESEPQDLEALQKALQV